MTGLNVLGKSYDCVEQGFGRDLEGQLTPDQRQAILDELNKGRKGGEKHVQWEGIFQEQEHLNVLVEMLTNGGFAIENGKVKLEVAGQRHGLKVDNPVLRLNLKEGESPLRTPQEILTLVGDEQTLRGIAEIEVMGVGEEGYGLVEVLKEIKGDLLKYLKDKGIQLKLAEIPALNVAAVECLLKLSAYELTKLFFRAGLKLPNSYEAWGQLYNYLKRNGVSEGDLPKSENHPVIFLLAGLGRTGGPYRKLK